MRAAPWMLAALLLAGAAPATAKVLMVGPGQAFTEPSAAARQAQDGDEIRIAPGTYYDCAVWGANRLTIAAEGAGVVFSDRSCEGKAAFVIRGHDVVVRGLTFTRLRVADHNAAGIRAEGGSLTVEDCTFINDEAGILTAGAPDAVLTVRRSRFQDVGACNAGNCTSALMVGGWAGLDVTDSEFSAPRAGFAITSQARRVTLRGNRVLGGPSRLIRLDVRGPVVLQENLLVQHGTGDAAAAVLLTGGAGPVALIANTYRREGGGTMVQNWSGAAPVTQDNVVAPSDTLLTTSGAWLNDLREGAHAVYDPARALAGKVKGKVVELGGRALHKLGRVLPF